jgi:hypothetical protein
VQRADGRRTPSGQDVGSFNLLERHPMRTLTSFAASLLLAAGAAQAQPDYAGHHGTNPCSRTVQMGFTGAVASPVDQVYEFMLRGAPHEVLASAVVLPGRQGFTMPGAMVTLWRDNADGDYLNDELIGGFDFGTAAVAMSFAALPAGRYFWRLEGIANGSGGGMLFSSAITQDRTRCTVG